ncbi:MAG: hypothetical protein RLZZ400_807 [Actinomycetota bacterium]
MTSELQDPQSVPAESAQNNVPLNANDRCDSCGAQAYVRATLQFGELLFCLHHATLNKTALEPMLIHWHDESERLLTR